MLETAFQDIRYGIRLLSRSPLFTATAVLSLAIGIGANTAIFAPASAMLLRPLPGVQQAGRLVDIGRTQNGQGFDTSSYPNYRDLRARVTTLTGVYAGRLDPTPMGLGGQDGAERIYGTIVTGNYFSILGTSPAAGRLLADSDDTGADGHQVMVISYELWQRRFAGDRTIIGQTVPLNGAPFAIVGVAPPGFQGTTVLRSDVWVPISAMPLAMPRNNGSLLTERSAVWLIMGGRLKPGVTVAQANAEVAAIGASLEREFPRENRGKGLTAMKSAVIPGHVDILAGFLALLMGIVGVVLLIACVNLSGMLLARAAGRRREVAVRLAIGATRARLMRQMLTETLLLFAAGGALGILLSRWLQAMLLGVLPQLPVPLAIDMPMDLRVLAFALVLSCAAALVAGLAPALQASRPDVVRALKAEGAGAGSRLRLRSAFLVGQVALSLLLVVTAALFLRSLGRAASMNPGFEARNVDVAMLDLSLAQYTDASGPAVLRDLVSRAAARPGVASAALAIDLPLDGGNVGLGTLKTPGIRHGESEEVRAHWNAVSPGYFRTLNLPLARGRDFDDADAAKAPKVAIVNEALARAAWGTADAVGRTFQANYTDAGWEAVTIVGVTTDAQVEWLGGEVYPLIYVPLSQRYVPRVSLLVKTGGESAIPQSAIPMMRAVVRELNPNLPVTQALPLTDINALQLIPQRVAGAASGAFGIVGLLLAAIGIYGVTSYTVHQRVREIGIRVALGADRSTVLAMILRQGAMLTALGVVIGLAAGAIVAQVIRSLLFDISALDPISFGAAALIFVAVSLLASYVPARRATRVDPMIALRAE